MARVNPPEPQPFTMEITIRGLVGGTFRVLWWGSTPFDFTLPEGMDPLPVDAEGVALSLLEQMSFPNVRQRRRR